MFLVTDIVAWTYVIYYSGGDKSWLFFLMFMRAADLQLSGTRAVLVAGHLSVLCYAAMLGWLIGVEHRPVALGAEVAKLVIIYAVTNGYLDDLPTTSIRPFDGCARPEIRRRIVDLPQPLGPTMDRNSPSRSVKSMSCRTSILP